MWNFETWAARHHPDPNPVDFPFELEHMQSEGSEWKDELTVGWTVNVVISFPSVSDAFNWLADLRKCHPPFYKVRLVNRVTGVIIPLKEYVGCGENPNWTKEGF